MMAARVTLAVIEGDARLKSKALVFSEPTSCVVGRAPDCNLPLPNDERHRTISRYHCRLDINPPDITVRDLSLNGTYVNGVRIGRREARRTPEEGARLASTEPDLSGDDEIEPGDTVLVEGDELRLGGTVFRVGIFAPAPRAKKPRRCAGCGKDVSREAGANRAGDFVCSACRTDTARVVRLLVELANDGRGENDGREELVALRGYRVARGLGSGGMGAVYLICHDGKSEQVALKVMLPEVAAEERATAQFLREVNNMEALRHPRLVRMHGHGCWHGIFFFVMEHCDGGDVQGLMDGRTRPLPLEDAVEIVFPVLDALEYAHTANITVELPDGNTQNSRGLVHRDVSPHNILLTDTGAKLADFGLAKAFEVAGLSGMTRTGISRGKTRFMPRQQALRFRYARPEVDVWAATACLYYMITGRYPRDFPRHMDLWRAVVETDPVPIRERDPSIPKELAEVMDLALDDGSEIHFKTAAQLKGALEAVI